MDWKEILTISLTVFNVLSLSTIKILLGINFNHTRKLRKKLAQKTLSDAQFEALAEYFDKQKSLREKKD